MSSLVEKIVPGYNTLMVFWIMMSATTGFLIFTVIRAIAYSGRRHDVDLSILLGICLIIIVAAQTNVQRVKGTRNLPKEDQPKQFTALSSEMTAWVWTIGILGIGALAAAGYLWFGSHPYDKPWSMLTVSFAVSMAGMAIDYEEWRRITILRSQDSLEKFRFPDLLHTGLNIAAYGLCLMGVVWCLVVYFNTKVIARA